jgi:aspartate-semialdehyde dehydrogenase
VQVLTERDFPYSEMKFLASARSAGRTYDWEGQTYTVEELTETRHAPSPVCIDLARN